MTLSQDQRDGLRAALEAGTLKIAPNGDLFSSTPDGLFTTNKRLAKLPDLLDRIDVLEDENARLDDYCEDLSEQLEPAKLQIASLTTQLETAREAAERLANAADEVGVHYFDTDTMDEIVSEMQQATFAVRAALKGGE